LSTFYLTTRQKCRIITARSIQKNLEEVKQKPLKIEEFLNR
jgi:hypothetical protein